jgi:hypothetical protein
MVVLPRTTVERIASLQSNGPNSDKSLIPFATSAKIEQEMRVASRNDVATNWLQKFPCK